MFVNNHRLALSRKRVHQVPRPWANRTDVARSRSPRRPGPDTRSDVANSQGRGSVAERLYWKQEVGSSILLVPTQFAGFSQSADKRRILTDFAEESERSEGGLSRKHDRHGEEP